MRGCAKVPALWRVNGALANDAIHATADLMVDSNNYNIGAQELVPT